MDRNSDGWIQTHSGLKFWPLDPRVDEVVFNDIAHALSMKCRFAGHTDDFYSVAQHSVIVATLLEKEHGPVVALQGLMHDAAEAYLPDVVRPIKSAFVGLAEYEDRLLEVIFSALRVPWPVPDAVKAADLVALVTERRDLMGPVLHEWAGGRGVELMSEVIQPLRPASAWILFTETWERLNGEATACGRKSDC